MHRAAGPGGPITDAEVSFQLEEGDTGIGASWLPGSQVLMRDPAAREVREKAFQAVSALVEAFERASPEERAAAAASLGDSAKGVMLTLRGRRLRRRGERNPRSPLIQGPLPVVIAGGRSETATGGGTLLAIILRPNRRARDARDLADSIACISRPRGPRSPACTLE